MTPTELREAIETRWPGHGGQGRAARHFSLKTSRRLRDYLSGARGVPAWMATELADLLKQFPDGIREVSPRKSLDVLHSQMVAQGFTPGEAAAAILNAAHALAQREIGTDCVADQLPRIFSEGSA